MESNPFLTIIPRSNQGNCDPLRTNWRFLYYWRLGPVGFQAKGRSAVSESSSSQSFVARNEFLIRRLFSLCGLVPVGAYMVVHLITNCSLLAGPANFQRAVNMIHSLGPVLPIVEWTFIFLPIIFHAVMGVVIIRGGLPNTGSYNYGSNWRYSLQRASGLIALVFIFAHVFHLHGWFHFPAWLEGVAVPLGGAQFKPYNAASTLGAAFQKSALIPLLYLAGVLSCVFHLSNGLWSFGIRWGIWTSPAAMRRAGQLCVAFGVGLGVVSVAATFAPRQIDTVKAKEVEDTMYNAKVASHDIDPDENKRSQPAPATPSEEAAPTNAAPAEAAPTGAGAAAASDANAAPVNSGNVATGN
jgi:succinate dehydrogenase / fumarate reductase, cytochrome b subunit